MQGETCIGASDDWYTPPEIFKALGLRFDLDPCSPGLGHWVPADTVYTERGLERDWHGRVFVNPPFGGRHGHVPWLRKFIDHGDGIAIVRAYTSSDWWHELMPQVDLICFPRGKTKFIRPDGSVGKSPGHGVALAAMRGASILALRNSQIGMCFTPAREAA